MLQKHVNNDIYNIYCLIYNSIGKHNRAEQFYLLFSTCVVKPRMNTSEEYFANVPGLWREVLCHYIKTPGRYVIKTVKLLNALFKVLRQ